MLPVRFTGILSPVGVLHPGDRELTQSITVSVFVILLRYDVPVSLDNQAAIVKPPEFPWLLVVVFPGDALKTGLRPQTHSLGPSNENFYQRSQQKIRCLYCASFTVII